jgi:hypothetical protein
MIEDHEDRRGKGTTIVNLIFHKVAVFVKKQDGKHMPNLLKNGVNRGIMRWRKKED